MPPQNQHLKVLGSFEQALGTVPASSSDRNARMISIDVQTETKKEKQEKVN